MTQQFGGTVVRGGALVEYRPLRDHDSRQHCEAVRGGQFAGLPTCGTSMADRLGSHGLARRHGSSRVGLISRTNARGSQRLPHPIDWIKVFPPLGQHCG